jgi:hypothetical protein
MLKLSFCCLLVLVYSVSLYAQQKDTTAYCIPSIVGLPRAKAFVLRYELISDYSIKTTAKESALNNGNGEVRQNQRLDLRLRIPVIYKSYLTAVLGLKYAMEEYHFENIGDNSFDFYKTLEDRPLKSMGFSLDVLKPQRGNHYFLFRASGNFNGDYKLSDFSKRSLFQVTLAGLMGWKRNPNLSYAVGLGYNATFGGLSLYPVVSVNHNFNTKWGLDIALPVSMKLRYKPNQQNYFFLSSDLSGSNYRLVLQDSTFSKYDNLHLRRSEVRFTLNWEHEIHDWLWFNVDAGLRYNLNFSLTNSNQPRTDILLTNKLNTAMLFNAGIFVVPPRRMLAKNKASN